MKIATIGLVVAALLVLMSYASGCSIDEIITVDLPPKNTRQHFRDNLATPVPPQATLRDVRILRAEGDRRFKQRLEVLAEDHRASIDALDREIADGSFIESLISSALNTGLETALPGVASVPGGAILTTLLAGLGMWFVPRPGDAKRQAKQVKDAEDKGYDMGRLETLDTMKTTE